MERYTAIMLNKKFILPSLLFTALLFSNLVNAQALPEFQAKYAIQKFGIKVAEAQYKLSHTDSGYQFTQHTKLDGLAHLFGDDTVSVVSDIDETNSLLLLTKHRYIQTGREKNKNEEFSIQWDSEQKSITGKITGVVRGEDITLETNETVWDVLSFQIPLMIDANKNVKHYPYKAILKGEIDTYNFILSASKKITFAEKEYTLLQMIRSDPKKDRQLHIWIAPELHNLPVIIENYRKGKEHSKMQLESVQFGNEKILIDQFMDNDEEY